MLEIAVLTCMEAYKIIDNMKGVELPLPIKQEIVQEIINRSDCYDGDV